MSDEKNPNINISGSVQGGMVNIGGNQTVHGSVSITMGDMTQTIQQGTAAPSDKEALQALVDQLRAAIAAAPIPAEHKASVERVAKRTEELVSEVSSGEIDKEAIESKANLLKKAAENIKDVLPTAVLIGASIVAQVLKMAGH